MVTRRPSVALGAVVAYNGFMSTLDPRAVPSEAAGRDALIAQLADADVLSVAALRHGRRAYVSGRTECFTALVVEELPAEFRGYGEPVALATLIGHVDTWGCLEVESELAQTVARCLRERSGISVRFYGSIYYELHEPVRRTPHEAIQTLQLHDLHLLDTADPELHLEDPERALRDGIVVGAVVDRRLVARASCVARSQGYGDIGVTTLQEFRGQGLATATASEVAHQLQQSQSVPVWSTGQTNSASQRVAAKLGFTLTTRRTYLIPHRDESPC